MLRFKGTWIYIIFGEITMKVLPKVQSSERGSRIRCYEINFSAIASTEVLENVDLHVCCASSGENVVQLKRC